MGLTEEQRVKRGAVTQGIPTFDTVGEDDYVFISYKSDDWETVLDKVVRHMVEVYGLRVYFDKNFDRDNDSWVKNMKRAIGTRKCRAVLAFVSRKYMISYACVMELLTARSKLAYMNYEKGGQYKKLPIIPIIVDHSRSVQDAMSKSGKEVVIKERNEYIGLLENVKESPWVRADEELSIWVNELARDQELTEEALSSVAEIILREGHERYFTENELAAGFYSNLREAIGKCSEDVFDLSLIRNEATESLRTDGSGAMKALPKAVQEEFPAWSTPETAEPVSTKPETAKSEAMRHEEAFPLTKAVHTSKIQYWRDFCAYVEREQSDSFLRMSKAADRNWYLIHLDRSIFAIECSVNTQSDSLRTAFIIRNNPEIFAKAEQQKKTIDNALKEFGVLTWDGTVRAAKVFVVTSRIEMSTEKQYEWFWRTAQAMYKVIRPCL